MPSLIAELQATRVARAKDAEMHALVAAKDAEIQALVAAMDAEMQALAQEQP